MQDHTLVTAFNDDLRLFAYDKVRKMRRAISNAQNSVNTLYILSNVTLKGLTMPTQLTRHASQ